jgi:hypothetical protein
MSQLSRRTLVSSAAALPALTVPALALAGNPDAELLRLGAQLAVLEQERAAQMAKDRAEQDLVEAEVEKRTGIALCDAPELTYENRETGYWELRDRACKELSGLNPDDEDENGRSKWDRVHSRLFPILNAILALRASTAEGLKVQARAIVLAASDLWDGEPQPENERHEQRFIEAACAHFGMDAKQIALAL